MTAEPIATAVDPSWTTKIQVTGSDDPRMALLVYDDGSVRFQHTCDRGRRGVVVVAPALQTGPHGTVHTVTSPDLHGAYVDDAITVSPSIHCADCDVHGYVRRGRWEAA